MVLGQLAFIKALYEDSCTVIQVSCTAVERLLYSGKFSREKTFTNFVVLWLFSKVFSAKFGSVASFGAAKV